MPFSEVVVFAVVWGALMMYFLTPFSRNTYMDFEENTKVTFLNILKDSFVKIAMHKKAIFALIMLIITLIYIWSSHSQIEWHNNIHGGGELSFNPTKQAIYYMTSLIIYAVFLYLFLAIRRTLMLLKKL